MKQLKKREWSLILCALLWFCSVTYASAGGEDKVRIWKETITLPTYFTNQPEECPLFFQHQSYQGASRVSYPYPVQDNLSMEKGSKEYTALFIENEYIKLCLLPEFGGRLFYATDKTNGYELFYRQHVIKPMLVGMLGAWISGGVEFCVFHHHRASTHMPVEYRLTKNGDGSATIWIGEFEPRQRMRWNLGISLFPDRSWVRVDGTLINATENTHSMLYWANVATHVNENYQVIFPPNTQYAVFHAKNSFSHWPVTTETYSGHDYYQDSIDASWYRNHPMQGSFFAHDIDVGILAGYDHGKQAGTMHVANHHIVKGAKLWQWGTNSTFDRQALTDNDGPYAEIMVGAYSDNQPDYSWIKPYEVKQFQQTWYPLRETRGMKHGNLDATVNLELLKSGNVFLAVNTTRLFHDVKVILENAGEIVFEKIIEIGPANPFSHELKPDGDLKRENLKIALLKQDGTEIISYQPEIIPYDPELPPEVVPPGDPSNIATNEELYYAGERIRQFHNARVNPADYFLEALKRDSLDVRCNTAMGIIHQEEGDFESAKFHYRKAISRITANYTRPRNCEPLYHLGVILKQEGKLRAAIDTLYRAAWDYEFRSAAYFQLAQIHTIRHDYVSALDAVDNSLVINGFNLNALSLKTSLLRLTDQSDKARESAHMILGTDRLNVYAFNELQLLSATPGEAGYRDTLLHLLRDNPENYLELAAYYMGSGLYSEATGILEMAVNSDVKRLTSYPTIYYYLGYLSHLQKRNEIAENYFARGIQQPIKYCFPFRLESKKVFQTALIYNPGDSRACYYLGNLLYDRQPELAIDWWEKAAKLEPELAMAHRNLGWGYQQTYADTDRAIRAYQEAIKHDPSQSRYYSELDRLLEKAGEPIETRLNLLTANHEHVSKLQGALMREILVLVLAGDYDRAIELMDGRMFYRQEDVNILHDIHVDAHVLKGKQLLEAGDPEAALKEFLIADTYPENQMIERPANYNRNPRIFYYSGVAQEAAGDKRAAGDLFEKASAGKGIEGEFLYYQAMACTQTGKKKEADTIFEQMIALGQEQLMESGEVDFFSKFGGELTEDQRKARSYHIIGMGYMGLGDTKKAKAFFTKSVESDVSQLWSRRYLKEL
ncbi:MAG: DUF5107 domain-containing protein [Bacteroidota bacterium]